MKRRQVMFGALGGIAILGIGVLGLGRGAAEDRIVSLLRARLSFLKLDEAGLKAFAHDNVAQLLAKRPSWAHVKSHFKTSVAKADTHWNTSSDRRTRTERTVDHMASTYLLSSNFFTVNKADPSLVVHYVALYDPLRPCGNPFARPVLVETPASEPGAKS